MTSLKDKLAVIEAELVETKHRVAELEEQRENTKRERDEGRS